MARRYGVRPFVGTREFVPGVPGFQSLVTVVAGNSISERGKHLAQGSTGWRWFAEVHIANTLAGSPLRFKRTTPTTRTDGYGVYGYTGAALATINADMAAQWFSPITSAGYAPDLAIGLALLENDLMLGSVSLAEMKAGLDAWIAAVRAQWPAAKILLCTPRPSFGYDTIDKVSNYQNMRDYTMSKDNGSTIFVSRVDTYEDPASPGMPLAGYTDVPVHPNANGSVLNARVIAATIRRIGRVAAASWTRTGGNVTATGATAASGTNVTGTQPTGGYVMAGSALISGVSTALQPGWRMTFSTPAPGVNLDIGYFNTPNNAASSPAEVSAFVTLRIISGAENLRSIQVEPRIQDAGGNTFRDYMKMQSADTDLGLVNGDVLTFVSPPMAPNSGAISQVTSYIKAFMKNVPGSCTVELVESGFYVPGT